MCSQLEVIDFFLTDKSQVSVKQSKAKVNV